MQLPQILSFWGKKSLFCRSVLTHWLKAKLIMNKGLVQ